jgi:hypothetical protein
MDDHESMLADLPETQQADWLYMRGAVGLAIFKGTYNIRDMDLAYPSTENNDFGISDALKKKARRQIAMVLEDFNSAKALAQGLLTKIDPRWNPKHPQHETYLKNIEDLARLRAHYQALRTITMKDELKELEKDGLVEQIGEQLQRLIENDPHWDSASTQNRPYVQALLALKKHRASLLSASPPKRNGRMKERTKMEASIKTLEDLALPSLNFTKPTPGNRSLKDQLQLYEQEIQMAEKIRKRIG